MYYTYNAYQTCNAFWTTFWGVGFVAFWGGRMGDRGTEVNPYRGRKLAFHRVTIKCTIDTFVQTGGDHVWSPTEAIYRIYTWIYVYACIFVHVRMWAGCVHVEFGVPIWSPGIHRKRVISAVVRSPPKRRRWWM